MTYCLFHLTDLKAFISRYFSNFVLGLVFGVITTLLVFGYVLTYFCLSNVVEMAKHLGVEGNKTPKHKVFDEPTIMAALPNVHLLVDKHMQLGKSCMGLRDWAVGKSGQLNVRVVVVRYPFKLYGQVK